MKAISTEKAPAAIGPYSQAIKVGNLVYTSGQIPIDPATGMIVTGGIKEQTEFFTEPYPARSAVAVKTLPKGALVEIEVIAEVKA